MAGNLFPQPSSLVEIQGSGKLTFGESSASGTRIAVVDAAQLFPAINFLMGYVYVDLSGKQVRLGADKWPYLPSLACTSVEVEPHGAMGLNGVGDWQNLGPYYEKAKLTVKYETLKYDEENDSNNPEDITFMTQELDYSCDILTVPMKVGSGASAPTVNRHIRLPLITYTITIPQVVTPPWNLFNSLVGMVNDSTLFGGEPGTVLFDGPKVSRTVTLLGSKAWQVVLKLIYNRHGWNKTLNPNTLVWENAKDKQSGNTPPYESGPLDLLFS
jgi:hypothetical protein